MVHNLIRLALRNRVLVLLVSAALLGWGIYSVQRNPVDAIPDLSENQVIVFTEWMGRSPQVVEDQVTYPLVSNLQGIKTYMATGDNATVAKAVSDTLGMDGFYAEVLPHQKVELIQDLQSKGEFVAMTGDGVNDAPALAQADVGIAVGSGTDVAAETTDIILVNSDPRDILGLILFGKATYSKMIQNLVWATAYNAIAIPLAAGVLYSFDFLLSPAVGAVFMTLSTVVVAINAQLLKRSFKLVRT